MTKEHGTMDFDFRKRSAVPVETFEGLKYEIVFYGLAARDLSSSGAGEGAYDLPSPYAELSEGGRTRPIEDEYKTRKHFFNKRIMTREESIGGQTVQTGSDTDRIRAHDGVGGASSAEEVASSEGGVGSGDQSTEGAIT